MHVCYIPVLYYLESIDDDDDNNTRIIIGAIVGGTLLLILVILFLFTITYVLFHHRAHGKKYVL